MGSLEGRHRALGGKCTSKCRSVVLLEPQLEALLVLEVLLEPKYYPRINRQSRGISSRHLGPWAGLIPAGASGSYYVHSQWFSFTPCPTYPHTPPVQPHYTNIRAMVVVVVVVVVVLVVMAAAAAAMVVVAMIGRGAGMALAPAKS